MPTIDPTVPADLESPRQAAQRIRSLTLQLLGIFSLGGGTVQTFNPPLSVDPTGNLTILSSLTTPVPTASGNAATKGYVDTGDANTLASANTYTNTQVSGISVNFPVIPAPVVSTTLVNTSIAASSSATILQVTSTPPAVPTTTQKYRAQVDTTVYLQAANVSLANVRVLIRLSDSLSIFATLPSVQDTWAVAYAQNTAGPNISDLAPRGLTLSAISDQAATNAGGAVTFSITAFQANSGTGNVTVATAATLDALSKTYLKVAWLPAS